MRENMPQVNVLVEGENKRDDQNKMSMGSTVSLIRSDKEIIVDTGSIPAKDTLIRELETYGLAPEDIDIVVLTHLHLDHIINASVSCKIFNGGSRRTP